MKLKSGLILTILSLSLLSCENGLWGEDETQPAKGDGTIYLYPNSTRKFKYQISQNIIDGQYTFNVLNPNENPLVSCNWISRVNSSEISFNFFTNAEPSAPFNWTVKAKSEKTAINFPFTFKIIPFDLFDHFESPDQDTIHFQLNTNYRLTIFLKDSVGNVVSPGKIYQNEKYIFNFVYSLPVFYSGEIQVFGIFDRLDAIYFDFSPKIIPDSDNQIFEFNFYLADKVFSIPCTFKN